MANGCAGAPVRLCELSQQDLFAQHVGAHAFWLGAFINTHADDEELAEATVTAATKTNESVILLNIS